MTRGKVMTLTLVALISLVVGAALAWYGPGVLRPVADVSGPVGDADHDEHGDHGDEDGHEAPGHDEHEGPADAHDHGAHEEGAVVRLSERQRAKVGVRTAKAGPGVLATRLRLPGQVVVNEDRTAHVVPRSPGVVRRVAKTVGDRVVRDEVLVVLESTELGQAKVEYLAKQGESSCCQLDLTRARAVHDNTRKMLALLERAPSLDDLRKATFGDMGEYRSKLVSVYAEFVLAKGRYAREKGLREKQISSEEDYLAAENAYRKAQAEYLATRDSVAFTTWRSLLEAERAQRLADLERTASERRLHVLGLTDADLKTLSRTAPVGDAAARKCDCGDPGCAACGSTTRPTTAPSRREQEELAWYALRAPFAGTIIERHAVLGERLGDDASAFTVADLATVWVDLSAYQKDLPHLRAGLPVTIQAGAEIPGAHARLAYVAPVIDPTTRTGLVRVVLPNPDGHWRPGLFVSADVQVAETRAAVCIPRAAVQHVDGEAVVFVPSGGGFAPRRVKLGRSDKTHVEVRAGLSAGQAYVVAGTFELKATLVTSGMDAHAGHGH